MKGGGGNKVPMGAHQIPNAMLSMLDQAKYGRTCTMHSMAEGQAERHGQRQRESVSPSVLREGLACGASPQGENLTLG